MAGVKAGKGSRKAKTKAVSRLQRAGLQFPAGRIHQHLKSRTTSPGHVGTTATVHMVYMQPPWSTSPGNASKDLKVKCVTPRHSQLATDGFEELDSLIKATAAGGGVIPHSHTPLTGRTHNRKRLNDARLLVLSGLYMLIPADCIFVKNTILPFCNSI
uniref:histone H2A.Z-like n=1 Tax=Callithrix jacchus TaxID=9483 RepID=UPI00159D81B2|nr:histone H2A.Z-like [Callithrix jacchus]